MKYYIDAKEVSLEAVRHEVSCLPEEFAGYLEEALEEPYSEAGEELAEVGIVITLED